MKSDEIRSYHLVMFYSTLWGHTLPFMVVFNNEVSCIFYSGHISELKKERFERRFFWCDDVCGGQSTGNKGKFSVRSYVCSMSLTSQVKAQVPSLEDVWVTAWSDVKHCSTRWRRSSVEFKGACSSQHKCIIAPLKSPSDHMTIRNEPLSLNLTRIFLSARLDI